MQDLVIKQSWPRNQDLAFQPQYNFPHMKDQKKCPATR